MDRRHPHQVITAQTPPDRTICLVSDHTTLLKMVGVGATTYGSYTANKEYWRATGKSFAVDSVTMEYGQVGCEKCFGVYFGGLTNNAWTPNNRTGPTWTSGKRTIPAGRTGYLFSLTDPDDATKKVGVLLEVVTTTGALVAAVFYKVVSPTNGQVWTTHPSATTTLSRVKDNGGNASTDPDNMGSGTTWYHTVMS